MERMLRVARTLDRLSERTGQLVGWLTLLMVLIGAMRGAGDTRMPLLITFVGLIGIRIPLACWFGWGAFSVLGMTVEGFAWGVAGAWWAMLIDVVVRSLLASWRFWQGGWKEIVV